MLGDARFIRTKEGSTRRPGLNKRRILIGLGVFILFLPVGYWSFIQWTAIRPPPISRDLERSLREQPLEISGQRVHFGDNWMTHERGLWELHLKGDPYVLGFAHARLSRRLLLAEEDYMFAEMKHYVPSKLALFAIRLGTRLRYRQLGEYVPLPRRLEIRGLADGSIDRHGDFLPAYHRLLFYHALHDITQGLEHSPMLGCSAFAASGAATVGGHLIVGRNFDFEGPEIFDREKIVLFVRPTGKIPFASIAWAGMSGAVTGINAEQIYISLNAARSVDEGSGGMPVELLLREVLENARTLDDAIRLIKHTPVMIPDLYLIADGKTGEAAVIERSPQKLEVRRMGAGHVDNLIVTNHALSAPFSGDAENDRLKRYLTSEARFKRMEELVHRFHGQIDPRRGLEILRDRKGFGDKELGLGNRNALDALIATHSAVVDATQMIMWVGEGPHMLGRFRAFDLKKELNDEERLPPLDLPEDTLAQTDEYKNHMLAIQILKSAAEMSEKDGSIDEVRKAEALDDKMVEPHRLLGDYYKKIGDVKNARREYQRFLDLSPPYLKEIEEVRGLLETLHD